MSSSSEVTRTETHDSVYLGDCTWIVETDSERQLSTQVENLTGNEVVSLNCDADAAFATLHRRSDGNQDHTHSRQFVWNPPPISTSTDIENLAVAVYRMRSIGCLGLVLKIWMEWELQQGEVTDNIVVEDYVDLINRALRKFQRPCSTMDNPPTMYMIGDEEGELS